MSTGSLSLPETVLLPGGSSSRGGSSAQAASHLYSVVGKAPMAAAGAHPS